jgi:glucose/arabinose dehydrogenase
VTPRRPPRHRRWTILWAALAALAVAHPGSAGKLPPDFLEPAIATGFDGAVNFDFLPDGRALVVEQFTGRIRLVRPGWNPDPEVVGTIGDLRTGVFDGLLGIAVDPAWPARPYVYTNHVSASSPNIKLIRHTLSGDLDFTAGGSLALDSLDSRVLLGDLPSDGPQHRGGTILFGPDGMLHVTLGDDDYSCAAQDPGDLRGKILRLDVDGVPDGPGPAPSYASLAAAGNPFANHPDPRMRVVYHYGLRNPWTIDFDPGSGLLAIADVGFESYEEIDVTDASSRNFGWPLFEGPASYLPTCPDSGGLAFTPPSFAYLHDPEGIAQTVGLGGFCFRGSGAVSFPDEYVGQLFYYDFFTGFLNRLVCVDGSCSPAPHVPDQPSLEAWGVFYAGVPRMRFGPDGALWYLQGGDLRRIVYAGTVDVDEGPAGAARLAVAAAPNPSAGAVAFDLRLAGDDPATLAILDVAGRRVRRFVVDAGSGTRRVRWDGRGDDGRPVGAGVYQAILDQGGARTARRLVRLGG